ncbi:MAG TPA: hypothetical protein VFO99_08230 [Pyrinomonadaceae bacterium]|nr:hypothetical protein [Pyrinomonadaceae bacterium]
MDRLLRAELQDTDLASRFERIYAESLRIWNSEPLPKYTTHGRDHMEQVEKNLDDLTRPLQDSKNPLTRDEIFVLLAGACLHDVGMHRIDDPRVRENHPVAAYEMILHSSDRVPSELREVTLPIDDRNAREAIAKIARGHWIDYALPLPKIHYINGNKRGRLRLLALLLAMADLLDMSSVRAHYFRSSHRLYDLEPVSELHHVKHELVKGFSIGPPDNQVPGTLRYDLEWNDNDGLVEIVNGWVMQWFNSQWRQLHPVLLEDSGGSIHWTEPWSKVIFHPREGPATPLSTAARHLLMAERAEQLRIDREDFASHFRWVLANKEAAVFLFPADSDLDWQQLSDWCEAYARSRDNCHVARIDVRGNAVFQFASIVGHIMKQWGLTMPVCADEEAIGLFENCLRLANSPDIVTIVNADEASHSSVATLLKKLMSRDSAAARVCLLICPKEKRSYELDNVLILEFDGSTFPRAEVEEFLQRKHGYSAQESSVIYHRMERANVTTRPVDVYAYIEDHCT